MPRPQEFCTRVEQRFHAARPTRDELARIVLDEMYQFVGILDAQGTVQEINRSALEAVDATREQVIGRPFWETAWWTVSPELQELLKNLVRRAASGEFVRIELQHYGGGRRELIDVDFSLKPIRGSSGAVAYLIAEGRNITERKRAEAEVTRKNDEIRSLYGRLKEFDNLKTQFFANVSHELRTPLTLILGPADKWLDSGDLSPKLRVDLDVIRRNARILLRLVNDLLDVSKLEAGRMDVHYARVDLARLVRETAANFDGLAQELGIAYAVTTPPTLLADIDAEKMQRVLVNLVSNAFKFTPPGGRIAVSLRVPADDPSTALLETVDSGPGIPPELRARIFERFYQVEGGPTRRVGGSGLGLTIAQEFTCLHHGTIAVDDGPGGGALFRVHLPLRAPGRVGEEGNAKRLEDVVAGNGGAATLGIAELETVGRGSLPASAPATLADRPLALVVEDNAEMNRFIAEVLTSRWRVARAFDGREGVEQALALRPDIIVSDIMMPRLSGDELVKAVREHPDMDGVPILMLTARHEDALRVRLLQDGAQDYILKPFAAAELLARASNWIAVSRTRRVLQHELTSGKHDLSSLAADLVERKRALGVMLDAAQNAREAAEDASRSKTDFLNLVSHELRTPLATILLQVQLMQHTDLPLPARSSLQLLDNSSTRLKRLLESVLEYTRIKSGRIPNRCEPIDVQAHAKEIVDELRPQAEQKGLELRFITEGTPSPPLQANPELLRLILVNLLGNAVKYTSTGGVTVSVACDDVTFRIAVADTGPGIPEEERSSIFEPFRQLGTVRHKHHPGFGLGLTIAREMAGALGARIELESVVGQGSIFTVVVPKGGC